MTNTMIHTKTPPEVIKVSANSRSTAVAGAIAGIVRESGRAEGRPRRQHGVDGGLPRGADAPALARRGRFPGGARRRAAGGA